MSGDIQIFILQNDEIFAKRIEFQILKRKKCSCNVKSFSSINEILFEKVGIPDIVIMNYNVSDSVSDDFILKLKKINPNISIIVVSEQENIKTAVRIMKMGVEEYLFKDESTIKSIDEVLNRLIKKLKIKRELDYDRKTIREKYRFENLIGESAAIKKVHEDILKVLNSKINISLHGEEGSGKELIAQIIHYNSDRFTGPFLSVNLNALPDEYFEESLFGIDASVLGVKFKQGVFERANKGTLYLSGFNSLSEQKKLRVLKVLQSKELRRLGGEESLTSLDFRLIMSYNYSFDQLITKKLMDETSYFSIMGVSIEIPPLRERKDDIVPFANNFLRQYAAENNIEHLSLTEGAELLLQSHSYSGNIHELKSIIDVAAALRNSDVITENDISFKNNYSLKGFLNEENTLKGYTNGIIKHYMDKYENNVLVVAEKLDVGKSTIYRMIKNGEI
jgi:two-component system response regulator AtoC